MVIRSGHINATTQLEIPVFSNDGDAPNEACYFNSSDNVVKYKDASGNVHTANSGDAELNNHTSNTSNPHEVTASQTDALPASDYNPEADTHDKYTDSEAIGAINSDVDHGSTASHDYFSGDYSDLSNIPSTFTPESHDNTAHSTNYIPDSEKGSADGVAELDSNAVVRSSQVPDLAVTETHTVADESERLALTVEEGDIAIQTDESQTYIFTGGDASSTSNWSQILFPEYPVDDVFGRTGSIDAQSGDYTHDQIGGVSSDDHHIKYADSDAISAINSDTDHGSTASHDYFSGDYADLSNVPSTFAPADHDNTAHSTDYLAQADYTPETDTHDKYTDSEAISAVEGESTLDFTGVVTLSDTLNFGTDFSFEVDSGDLVLADDSVELVRFPKSGPTRFIQGAEIGSIESPEDSYSQLVDTSVTDALNSGDMVGYTFAINSQTVVSVEAEADGSGGISNRVLDISGELHEQENRVATRTWANSNFNNYTFSEDYTDLSNRSHGNEDHDTSYLSQSNYTPEIDAFEFTDGEVDVYIGQTEPSSPSQGDIWIDNSKAFE